VDHAAIKHFAVRARRADSMTAKVSSDGWTTRWAITGTQPVVAPKPPEALLGALATCVISGLQREADAAGLAVDAIEVSAEATKTEGPEGPRMDGFRLVVTLASPDSEAAFAPLFADLQSNGTVTNTLKLRRRIDIECHVARSNARSERSEGK
jgi:uncharacterized OsmC-like protein